MKNYKHFSVCFVLILIFFQVFVFAKQNDNVHHEAGFTLADGNDLSRKNMRGIDLRYELGSELEFRNINFHGANISNAWLEGLTFINCSFRETNLSRTIALSVQFIDCDFTDALVNGGVAGLITREELQTTASYKKRDLSHATFPNDVSGLDFSGFYLKGAWIHSITQGCKFDNAMISGASFGNKTSKEQLFVTKDFREKNVIDGDFSVDFSGADFSEFNFTNSGFLLANLKDVLFTDTVISGCNFEHAKNLTLSQIKSTWNYKTGNMAGIQLPKEIQDALDAEKE